MATILVTGASGYIGKRFGSYAERAGHVIVSPGSSWRLGAIPSRDVFSGVDAVVHLAHSWVGETTAQDSVNLRGTCDLADAALAAGVGRFVFVSSVSARPDALNVYGRTKYMTECAILSQQRGGKKIVCARVGLAYGGELAGQYRAMHRLANLTSLLPMIGLDRQVQPIHVDEVCQGLLQLAMRPELLQSVYVLAGPVPMRFGSWLRLLRRAETGKGLAFIPLPIELALLTIRWTRAVPGLARIDFERILGLASTKFRESATDLKQLGVATADPVWALTGRQTSIREARALLQYLLGRKPPKKAVIRLARVIERDGGADPPIPRLALMLPCVLRFLEPIHANSAHRLGRHLHFAFMVAEAMPREPPRNSVFPIKAFGEVLLEILALPIRILTGR